MQTVDNHSLQLHILISLFLCTLPISGIAQYNAEIETIFVEISSTFGSLPERYLVNMTDKSISYVSSIINNETGKPIKTKKKVLSKKKWSKLHDLIEAARFPTLESSESQGIDGAWFTFSITFEDKRTKKVRYWSGDSPKVLGKIVRFLRDEA